MSDQEVFGRAAEEAAHGYQQMPLADGSFVPHRAAPTLVFGQRVPKSWRYSHQRSILFSPACSVSHSRCTLWDADHLSIPRNG